MPGVEKFIRTLHDHEVDQAVIERITSGFEGLSDASPRTLKREFFRHAMDVLDSEVSRPRVVCLMDDNGCCKGNSARAKASRAFAKANAALSIEERLPLIAGVKNMGRASLTEDGRLCILAVEYSGENGYRCACPSINTTAKEEIALSRTYCLCCAGHFRYHYQIMLGCGLRLESVRTSPLDSGGREPCSFIFEILK